LFSEGSINNDSHFRSHRIVMAKHIDFCVPAAKNIVSSGPDWLPEVKYASYRGRVERDGKSRVLFKTGLDWTWRFS
jgi:hypothetical protein